MAHHKCEKKLIINLISLEMFCFIIFSQIPKTSIYALTKSTHTQTLVDIYSVQLAGGAMQNMQLPYDQFGKPVQQQPMVKTVVNLARPPPGLPQQQQQQQPPV